MFRNHRFLQSAVSLLVLASFGAWVPAARANDIVPSSDLSGGASAFVFRGSSKKPQSRAAAGRAFSPNSANARANRSRIRSQAAERRKQREAAAKARAAELARIRARQKNAKIRQSNVLTAKAETAMTNGQVDAAITDFRAALALNAKNAEAIAGLSDALTVKGIEAAGENASESAVPYFEEAIKLNDKNDVAYSKLGEIHDANGRGEQAIAAYEKALALDPEFSSLYQPLGLAYAEQGNDAKAEEYLAKADAKGIASTESRLARAMIFSRQNRLDEAIAVIDQIITAEPQFAPAYYQKGRIYDAGKQPDAAIQAYQQAVKADPAYATAWFDLGVAYYNKADYTNAEIAYQEVLKHDPANAQAHANLASVYRQQERFADANAQYRAANEKGIQKDPDLYSEWGYCLGKTNDWDKATVRLKSAETLSPTAVDNNNVGWAYYNAAREDKAKNDEAAANEKLTIAKASFEKSAEMDPNLSAAQLNLGATNNALGDFEAAAVALNRALALQGNWVIALNQLGLAYRGSNNLTAAISAFDRAVNLDGNNAFGLFGLGSAQHANGDKKGAKKTQDRLKKLNPELANQLGNVIAGKVIDAGKQKIKEKIRIPGIPF
ncbi:MAG: tetratricopeptide repeat protein [Pyrinomonadaceae bacterium]|nr:tetratricopeptide repeat protein [Pyrinomonadaceae bacterium]